jgi:L-threonylcarbamoyladenylate synthase
MTRVLRVDREHPDPAVIQHAARELQRGGLVAFPTETVYGLGADALDAEAVERIFAAKGRPPTDPVIVHLAHTGLLPQIAQNIPASAWHCASAFWPGPLTLILEKTPWVPGVVSAGLPTVGVRVPSHPVARALLTAVDGPVAAPSANRFSRPSPTCAEHVLDDLDGAIDIVLDAGPTSIGIESTILDLTVSPALVLRPGGVTLDEIVKLVPDARSIAQSLRPLSPQPAPGQLLRHYAPRAKLTLYIGPVEAIEHRVATDARSLVAAGSRVGILAPAEDLLALAPRLAAVAATGRILTGRYGSRADRGVAARELFAALRDLDAEGVDIILASAPEARDLGLAIIDRLTRAAEGRVVQL